MAETVAVAIANFAAEAFAADAIAVFIAAETAIQVTAVVAAIYGISEQKRRAMAAQRDAYNASLRDRYVMSRGASEPRALVLGRQRVSGPIFYVGSYGADREHLVTCIALAAHEIDAVEKVYFNDEELVIDGAGNVTNIIHRETFSLSAAYASFTLQVDPGATVTAVATYGSAVVPLTVSVSGKVVTVSGGRPSETGVVEISYLPAESPYGTEGDKLAIEPFMLDSSGNGSITLANDPVGSIEVVYNGPGDGGSESVLPYASISGRVITVTGFPLTSVTVTATYQCRTGAQTKARIRAYLGAPGQVADAGMIAALPGVWTPAHTASGIAYLVVELDYDTDAFSGGLPNVSAQIRGAKVYDPRTGSTAWSENPALLARCAATHELCGRLPASLINDASVIAAANVCDQAVTYNVNGKPFARALYTAGTVHKSGTRPQETITDIVQAMAGKWVFIDGVWRVKAGAYSTPLQTLDDSWLTTNGSVKVSPRPSRGDTVNVITGTFADETADYLVKPFPRVAADAYITEDGAELPLSVTLGAVTFNAQAQQVAAVMMRDSRQGLRLTVTCNYRAYAVEPLDVLSVTLDRFGWVNKPFEVLDVSFTAESGITLTLKETDASIYALGADFADVDPAPNTQLPPPNVLPAITSLGADSDATTQVRQADGTVAQRLRVHWDALSDPAVIGSGGGIQIQYGLAHEPADRWLTVDVGGSQTEHMLSGILFGSVYRIRARAFNSVCRGKWCDPISVRADVRSIEIGTNQILTGATTDTLLSSAAAGGVGNAAGTPGATNANTVVHSWAWTNNVRSTPVTVQFEGGLADSTLSWNSAYPTGTTAATLEWSSASLSGSISLCSQWPDVTTQKGNVSPVALTEVALPAGETLTVSLRVRVVHTAAARISWAASYLRGTAIKS